jgi:hypothetical protein
MTTTSQDWLVNAADIQKNPKAATVRRAPISKSMPCELLLGIGVTLSPGVQIR